MHDQTQFREEIRSEIFLILFLDTPRCDSSWLQLMSKNYSIPLLYPHNVNGDKSNVSAIYCELSKKINREYLSSFPKLRIISTPTTSLTHIDLEYCHENSIKVISLKDFPDEIKHFSATIEIGLWHLLNLTRKTSAAAFSVVAENWNRNEFVGNTLREKSVGILGFGRLGQAMAEVCKILGMHVLIYDIDSEKYKNSLAGITPVNSAEDLFALSDFISVHVDDRPSNENLIDSKLLGQIKKNGVFLINTSRGFVVNEEAISNALRSSVLAGYGTDVLVGEEIREEDTNWLAKNKIYKAMIEEKLNISITPHIGGATNETMLTASQLVLERLFMEFSHF